MKLFFLIIITLFYCSNSKFVLASTNKDIKIRNTISVEDESKIENNDKKNNNTNYDYTKYGISSDYISNISEKYDKFNDCSFYKNIREYNGISDSISSYYRSTMKLSTLKIAYLQKIMSKPIEVNIIGIEKSEKSYLTLEFSVFSEESIEDSTDIILLIDDKYKYNFTDKPSPLRTLSEDIFKNTSNILLTSTISKKILESKNLSLKIGSYTSEVDKIELLKIKEMIYYFYKYKNYKM